MELLSLKEFVEDMFKYNTFIVDGQLCLDGIVTKNYEKNGIFVLADYNHIKRVVRNYEIGHIVRIEKVKDGDRYSYKIIFDESLPQSHNELLTRTIICYNRNDIGSIPAEDCGIDLIKLIDKDIFDDTKSFLILDDVPSVAVIGLDLRRLRLNERQKLAIGRELREVLKIFDPTFNIEDESREPVTEPSETLCLVVEINDCSFSFQGLDVNSFTVKPLSISIDLHSHDKVKGYIQRMVSSYNLACSNIKNCTDLIKELCELTK